MNILPQNFKNIIKNKLKEFINNKLDNALDNICDSIFNLSNFNTEYTNIIINIEKEARDSILQTIKIIIEEFDLEYKYSKNRKEKYTINKSDISRTITTLFGDLKFTRTYYKSKESNTLHFLLDEELGIPKYDKYDPLVKALAIDLYSSTSLKKSSEIMGQRLNLLENIFDKDLIKNIPRQSIYNWIKEWNIPKVSYEERDNVDTLFIMGDEKYIGCQNADNDIMVKTFVIFEGIKKVGKNRNQLINKHQFSTVSKTAMKDLSDFVYSIYNDMKLKNIYFMSDGGNWMVKNLDELKMNSDQSIKRLHCEFHYKQAINHISSDKDIREILKLSFKDDTKKGFKEYADSVILLEPSRKEIIEKKVNYILNNYNEIKEMLNFKFGSSMEAHISHNIASHFAERPKGYSTSTIEKYLIINDYKNNNINLFNLYLNTYNDNENTKIYKKENINLNILEKSNNNVINDKNVCTDYENYKLKVLTI